MDSLFIFILKGPAPTEIYTLSLHDALPIFGRVYRRRGGAMDQAAQAVVDTTGWTMPRDWLKAKSLGWSVRDRKSTRLNSSHSQISYAVFCLKKKIRTGRGFYKAGLRRCP